jgi:hypothetical protein
VRRFAGKELMFEQLVALFSSRDRIRDIEAGM